MSKSIEKLDALYSSLKENIEIVEDAFLNRTNKEPSGPYCYIVDDLNRSIYHSFYTELLTHFLRSMEGVKYVEVDLDLLLQKYAISIQTEVNNWSNHYNKEGFAPLSPVKLERKAK
jgi:hypothetical protein